MILNRKDYCLSCEHILSERGYEFVQDFPAQGTPENTDALVCKNCGQIISPELESVKNDYNTFLTALKNPKLRVVAFVAPSVRAGIGEEFGERKDCQQKIVAMLKKLGVHSVFSMNFGADLTIMEESKEFEERLNTGKNLPLLTSCCPAWVNYFKKMYPDLMPYLSTCKSPQQMMGAIINSYYAEQVHMLSTEIFVVSVVPCLAKKIERLTPENGRTGYDVDACITTKELAKIVKDNNIDFYTLKDLPFDSLFKNYSGGGAGFGMSGGVSESVVCNIFDDVKFETKQKEKYVEKLAHTKYGDLLIAQVQGVTNTTKLLDEIRSGKCKYHLIEVMACTGGCIGGPGQPTSKNIASRKKILEGAKKSAKIRNAKDNPIIKKLYRRYLSPQKVKALLHTS